MYVYILYIYIYIWQPIVNASLRLIIMKGHVFSTPTIENPASRFIGDWFVIETKICCTRINYCKRRNQYDNMA